MGDSLVGSIAQAPLSNPDAKNGRHNPHVSQSGGKRPENKDNLDSREGEEQEFKGDELVNVEEDDYTNDGAKDDYVDDDYTEDDDK